MNNAVARMSDVTRIINDTNETHQLARDLVNGAQRNSYTLFCWEWIRKNIRSRKWPAYSRSRSSWCYCYFVSTNEWIYEYSLAIELKDDSKLKVEDAIGQAIYSTSKRTIEDSIFEFDIVLQLFQDEDESIKRWLVDALKIVDDNKHGMN